MRKQWSLLETLSVSVMLRVTLLREFGNKAKRSLQAVVNKHLFHAAVMGFAVHGSRVLLPQFHQPRHQL